VTSLYSTSTLDEGGDSWGSSIKGEYIKKRREAPVIFSFNDRSNFYTKFVVKLYNNG
jgi:hypothetical protein